MEYEIDIDYYFKEEKELREKRFYQQKLRKGVNTLVCSKSQILLS